MGIKVYSLLWVVQDLYLSTVGFKFRDLGPGAAV